MPLYIPKIYYLGPRGSYTEQATNRFFKNGCLIEILDIYQILDKIARERRAYGVVPVENSTEGSLKIVLDTVVEKDLKIIGEVYLPISHCLIGKVKKLKKIKKIYSHPQALAQAGDWLRNNLPRVEIKEAISTSAAAQIVLRQKYSAAIASEYCAKIYGLKILADQLEENPNNYTRFWVLGARMVYRKRNDKISLFVILNDRVAALRDLLNIFAEYQLNLTKIESRALKGRPWQYGFFIDFFGNLRDDKIKSALKKIKSDVAWLRILGNYQNRQRPKKITNYLINYLQNLFKDNKKRLKMVKFSIRRSTDSDNLLIKLLQTRLLLTPSIALYKYLNKVSPIKIYQPKREQEIINKRLIKIKKKNIVASELLIKLAKQNLLISKEIQKDICRRLSDKTIKPDQIKKMKLSKLRDFLDQIDENFDEILANMTAKKQEKRLKELLTSF